MFFNIFSNRKVLYLWGPEGHFHISTAPITIMTDLFFYIFIKARVNT